jgi:hypothetical protein
MLLKRRAMTQSEIVSACRARRDAMKNDPTPLLANRSKTADKTKYVLDHAGSVVGKRGADWRWGCSHICEPKSMAVFDENEELKHNNAKNLLFWRLSPMLWRTGRVNFILLAHNYRNKKYPHINPPAPPTI